MVLGVQQVGSGAKRRWVSAGCVGASRAPAILPSPQTGSFPGRLCLGKNTTELRITGTLLSKKPQSLCAWLLNTRKIIISSSVILKRRFGLCEII